MLPSSMDIIKKTTSSSSHIPHLPPGFRFHPSDEELIVHYLRNKVTSIPLPASIIAEIDLYKYNPWDLPKKALFGEEEWYFFTPRERKYPNGARPNRAAASGYWKATGTDRPILTSCGTKSIGVKKALVFYKGRPPKGYKTDWIMHEYRLLDAVIWTPKRKGSMKLDDWVLCRVRQKSSSPRNTWEDRNGIPSYEAAAAGFFPKVNELWPMNNPNPNYNIDQMVVKSKLYNDCPMLPYIFASQDHLIPPCINNDTTSSSITVQDSDISAACSQDLQFSVSSFDGLFINPLKRKRDVNVLPSKKIASRESDKEDEEVVISVNDIYETVTDRSHDDINFSHDQWSSVMQYQELNCLAFTDP